MILLALKGHPKHPLVLAANRDEFYARPSTAVHFWEDSPHILAGRDLQRGGTWLGIDRSGRLAAISNYRDPVSRRPDARSRGLIVSGFLRGRQTPPEYLRDLHETREDYHGFNLIVGDRGGLYYYSSRTGEVKPLAPGLYGLSNALLDTPWPKVERGKSGLHRLLAAGGTIVLEALFELLADRSVPTDAELPDTGVGLAMERMLSSVFITSSDYGTRCSTIVSIDNLDNVTLVERSFDAPSGPSHNAYHRFKIETT